jgi:phage protein D
MTQIFTDLERAHQDLYVPAYQIKVNDADLLEDLFMEIASVQVDNTLKGADRFTFTVNSMFNFEDREFAFLTDLFAFGNSVEIRMGYKDSQKLPLMLRGKVTAVQTSFPASGLPQITVSGYDLSYCMTVGTAKKPLKYPDQTDSEIVTSIAGQYGLNPIVQDTRVKHPLTEKGQQSDMQFVERLAERNGFEFYTFDRDLYFQPPANEETGLILLEWGKGLLSFSPELNISQQITKVEVRGWDVASKKEIVGTAGKGEEGGRDSGRHSGGEVMQSVCRESGELKVRIPVFSKQEAERWAEAILKKRAELFVQGTGESIGLPEIRADQNIRLGGLGQQFSKRYYVEQSTHTINTSGYRTTFKIKDTTI